VILKLKRHENHFNFSPSHNFHFIIHIKWNNSSLIIRTGSFTIFMKHIFVLTIYPSKHTSQRTINFFTFTLLHLMERDVILLSLYLTGRNTLHGSSTGMNALSGMIFLMRMQIANEQQNYFSTRLK
jgi:hypothetical protein